MKKFVCTLIILLVAVWLLGVMADRKTLHEELIRLHVVADSDSDVDQNIKLRVRDAVVSALQPAMADLQNAKQARAYLSAHLAEVEQVANDALAAAGSQDTAEVTLAEEAFPIREYDTFSLPSGVYHSLRITIGEGQGKNWWCVVFPSLCLPAAGEDFSDTAAGAGFSDGLTDTLEGERPYQVRFYFLDLLGKIQNFFHSFV